MVYFWRVNWEPGNWTVPGGYLALFASVLFAWISYWGDHKSFEQYLGLYTCPWGGHWAHNRKEWINEDIFKHVRRSQQSRVKWACNVPRKGLTRLCGQSKLAKSAEDFIDHREERIECDIWHSQAMVLPSYTKIFNFMCHELMCSKGTEVVWNNEDEEGHFHSMYIWYCSVIIQKNLKSTTLVVYPVHMTSVSSSTISWRWLIEKPPIVGFLHWTGEEECSERCTELDDRSLGYCFTCSGQVYSRCTDQVSPQGVCSDRKDFDAAYAYVRDFKTVHGCCKNEIRSKTRR